MQQSTNNAFVESLNGKFEAEYLNASGLLRLKNTRSKCEGWRKDYNEVRPHGSIGHKAPIKLARSSEQASVLCGSSAENISDRSVQHCGQLQAGPTSGEVQGNTFICMLWRL